MADAADVARRTLYYHFNNKETLILEIAGPIFNDGLVYLEEISRKESPAIDDITGLCLFLWNKYRLSLNLLYTIDFENFHSLRDLHKRYLDKYIEVFNRLSDIPGDLEDHKLNIASILFRSFVPILTKIDNMDNPERRFRNCIRGMIEGMSETGGEPQHPSGRLQTL